MRTRSLLVSFVLLAGCSTGSTEYFSSGSPANPDGGPCPVDPAHGACSVSLAVACTYVVDGGTACDPQIYTCDPGAHGKSWVLQGPSDPGPSDCPATLPKAGDACTNIVCRIAVCGFSCDGDAGQAVARCLGERWSIDDPTGGSCIGSDAGADASATSDAGDGG